MSNAMRSGKRLLAGVAAGALALGALTIASAPAASAKPSIKPKAALTGTVSGVRATTLPNGSLEAVPYAAISWTAESSTTVSAADTVAIQLTSSPAGSTLVLANTQLAQNAAPAFTDAANARVTVTNAAPTGAGTLPVATSNNTTKAQSVLVAVNEPGPYSGVLTVTHGNTGVVDTVSFSFTTTGAPTSMTITPATSTIPASATASLTVTLRDAAGKVTQPTTSDSVAWTTSPATGAGSVSPSPLLSTVVGAGASLALGTATVTYTAPATGGTFGVTGTPLGSLPSTGVTAQSVSVTVQSTVALASAIQSAPAAGVTTASPLYTAPVSVTAAAAGAQALSVSPTVSAITFSVTAATGSAPGSLIPVTVATNTAGVTPVTTTIPVNASLVGTYTVTAPITTAGSSYVVTFGQAGVAQVAYTVTYAAPVLNIGNLTTAPALGTNSFVKTAEATTVAATVTDQFGLPLPNILVTSVPSVSTASSATTGADGKATVPIGAPSASTTSQTVAFNLTPPLGSATGNSSALTLTYNSSGAPASLTASSTAGSVAQTATATQYVDTAGTTNGVWAATSVTTQTQWLQLTATVGGSAAAVPVTFSGTDVYFNAGSSSNLNSATTKKGSIAATTNGAGVATVFAKATKTGAAKVTLTAGTLSTEIVWQVANQASDARVIEVTPATQDAAGLAQVRAKVTDAFGNTVANASLNFAEEGVGNFATGTSTVTTATGPNGSVTVDVLSTTAGDSTVTVSANATANYAGAADAPVTGAPKGVSAGAGKIKFGVSDKSITITGSRTTVSGKPGIKVDGAVTGIDNGRTVIPYFRFPGETTFSQGTARPVITAGKFTWERKTGKKFYAYVTSDDGVVKSNRVIIAAN